MLVIVFLRFFITFVNENFPLFFSFFYLILFEEKHYCLVNWLGLSRPALCRFLLSGLVRIHLITWYAAYRWRLNVEQNRIKPGQLRSALLLGLGFKQVTKFIFIMFSMRTDGKKKHCYINMRIRKDGKQKTMLMIFLKCSIVYQLKYIKR